jgi:aerobic C4-dicarboxylate transport protein
MVLILGIDRFMAECRALTNIIGNGVAAIVVSAWEGELDRTKLAMALGDENRAQAIPRSRLASYASALCRLRPRSSTTTE